VVIEAVAWMICSMEDGAQMDEAEGARRRLSRVIGATLLVYLIVALAMVATLVWGVYHLHIGPI
jgi:hypothetical protein